jgi:hypothetical protein
MQSPKINSVWVYTAVNPMTHKELDLLLGPCWAFGPYPSSNSPGELTPDQQPSDTHLVPPLIRKGSSFGGQTIGAGNGRLVHPDVDLELAPATRRATRRESTKRKVSRNAPTEIFGGQWVVSVIASVYNNYPLEPFQQLCFGMLCYCRIYSSRDDKYRPSYAAVCVRNRVCELDVASPSGCQRQGCRSQAWRESVHIYQH